MVPYRFILRATAMLMIWYSQNPLVKKKDFIQLTMVHMVVGVVIRKMKELLAIHSLPMSPTITFLRNLVQLVQDKMMQKLTIKTTYTWFLRLVILLYMVGIRALFAQTL